MQKKRKVLMSIKPQYVKEIVSRKKLFEFRKSVFDPEMVEKVVIYASSPIKRIVAEFDIADILEGSPEQIWNRCKEHAGIDHQSFMDYFSDREVAFSIAIDQLTIYDDPINPYEQLDGFRPPQSYMYFNTKLESVFSGAKSA